MKLLLSNDDGAHAEGIRVLAAYLSRANDVCVSAPDMERSAVSRSMTLFSPLRARKTTLQGLKDIPAYAVSGTPVDCVRLALGNLFPAPDVVVSGINLGPNLGTDTLYSGTVAAAHEAALLGYQAVAVSCLSYKGENLETAAFYAARAIEYIRENPLPWGTLLNVNVPGLPLDAIKGVKCVPLGVVEYALKYVEREDPMGEAYYWPPRGRISNSDGKDVDDRWAREGYVTVTPITYDLTDQKRLCGASLNEWNWCETPRA